MKDLDQARMQHSRRGKQGRQTIGGMTPAPSIVATRVEVATPTTSLFTPAPAHNMSTSSTPLPPTSAASPQTPPLRTVHDYLQENTAVLGSLGGLAAALAIVPTFVTFPIANIVVTSLLYVLVVITIRAARSTIPPSSERTLEFDVFAGALRALQYVLLFVGIIYYHSTYRFLLPTAIAVQVMLWSIRLLRDHSWYSRPFSYAFEESAHPTDKAKGKTDGWVRKLGVRLLLSAPYWVTCVLTAVFLPQITFVLDVIQLVLLKVGR